MDGIMPSSQIKITKRENAIMPRRQGLRAELQDTGLISGPDGEERGRITPNGTLILNEQALYLWLLRYASKQGRFKVSVNPINIAWSATGGYGYDPYVNAALFHLSDLGVVELELMNGQIRSVSTRMSAARAMDLIPQYITRAEKMAGLEPVLEDGHMRELPE